MIFSVHYNLSFLFHSFVIHVFLNEIPFYPSVSQYLDCKLNTAIFFVLILWKIKLKWQFKKITPISFYRLTFSNQMLKWNISFSPFCVQSSVKRGRRSNILIFKTLQTKHPWSMKYSILLHFAFPLHFFNFLVKSKDTITWRSANSSPSCTLTLTHTGP